ncbi:hypothetical protein [Archangium violaceum]|uniref:Gingipain domain-containing protein n=1 Tax=Archangium violaceum Cb vi76 TaxID=1406225 RepID=A0A084SHN9_9BACT|nr:hypothetical protein [Archangium violaceum]KFA87974.1 hypothetical protein Q664_44255 [Archangium violaceum Cb vi76]
MLALFAPSSFRRPLVEALGAAGLPAVFHRRPEPGDGGDPFHLEALARRLAGHAGGVLLVAPPHRSPRTVVPGPVVGGLPVGVLFAREPGALSPWLEAVVQWGRRACGPQAVLAAWEEHYLRLGRGFARHLRAVCPGRTITWFADRLNRPAMLERLAGGPALAAYFGHGHSDGLGGYHGVYREHVEAQGAWRPCGVFAAWACDTLVQARGGGSFGRFLVGSGRAVGFLGSTAAVRTPDNAALVELAGTCFERMRPANLGRWVCAIDAALVPGSPAWRAWRTYRLLGAPSQPL